MKVCFIYAEKDGDQDRELLLARAFNAGVALDGVETEIVTKASALRNIPDANIVCMVGVKSLKLFRLMQSYGKDIIYFDKGYFRHRGPHRTWEYWRIAVNDHHPTAYLQVAKHTPARWSILAGRLAAEIKPWREPGPGHILYCGSSEKYHAFAGLEDPTIYAQKLVERLRKMTSRKVVYRPKPSWQEGEWVKGAGFSPRAESIEVALAGAHVMITNGSNSCFDAILRGIPCIVLGNAIGKPISSQVLDDLEDPYLATDEERLQWVSNLAWCQFTENEMETGLAWQTVKPWLQHEMVDESAVGLIAGEALKPSKAILKKFGWQPEGRVKRSKEEQRRGKPFTKTKKKERRAEPPDAN